MHPYCSLRGRRKCARPFRKFPPPQSATRRRRQPGEAMAHRELPSAPRRKANKLSSSYPLRPNSNDTENQTRKSVPRARLTESTPSPDTSACEELIKARLGKLASQSTIEQTTYAESVAAGVGSEDSADDRAVSPLHLHSHQPTVETRERRSFAGRPCVTSGSSADWWFASSACPGWSARPSRSEAC